MTFEWGNSKIQLKILYTVIAIIAAIAVYFSDFTIDKAVEIVRVLSIFFCVYCAGLFIVDAYFENNKLHGKHHPLDDDEMWDLRNRLIQAEYEIDTLKREIQRKY